MIDAFTTKLDLGLGDNVIFPKTVYTLPVSGDFSKNFVTEDLGFNSPVPSAPGPDATSAFTPPTRPYIWKRV